MDDETQADETVPQETRVQEPLVLEREPAVVAAERYVQLELLGEGGMGEVRLYEDTRIGRRVAMKTMRAEHASSSRLRTRFVREARIQGQLEHPATVPVYDLGDAFFTMKRVQGVTLDELLDRLRRADRAAIAAFSPHKLLAAYAQVCLAIDYAHSRGVLHRDLKPANLMFGSFGEVYVLDWGLAKVHAERRDDEPEPVTPDPHPTPHGTAAGSVLGTPAYAPPEQLSGSVVDARADVWALGAILFEILTLEPLNPGTSVQAVIARTLGNRLEARPSVRTPVRDVPPELEEICVRATAFDPAARYPTARALHDAVERYLGGDRDREARTKLARDHEAAAREAADRGDRRGALAELGRSLALDPESQAAANLLHDLVDRAPPTPPEVQAELDRLADENLARMMPLGAFFYAGPALLLFLPLAAWMGIKSPLAIALCLVPYVASTALALWAHRRRRLRTSLPALVALSALAVACGSVLLGPFVFVPALATINAASFCVADPRINRTYVIVVHALAILVPALLRPVDYLFLADGSLRIVSHAVELPRLPTLVLLVLSSLFTVASGAFLLGAAGTRLRAADARRLTQRWQLDQLLPQRARPRHDV